MASEGLEAEVREAFKYIHEGKNFLLSGGAGSGKTYSLVQVIREITKSNPLDNIVCITYTNAAADEIDSRIRSPRLSVSTIHDFLWINISSFQRGLKQSLEALINDPNITKIRLTEAVENFKFPNKVKKIKYKEYADIKNGVISHDEVIILSEYMFKTYKKLCDIAKSKYQYILVDEYQDAFPEVIKILLNHLNQSKKSNIIGFFGDSMQSIYNKGVGDLEQYLENNSVYEIKKNQNRRNPKLVYELANILRSDGIIQTHSSDISAPNMENGKVKNGNIGFYYSLNSEVDEKISDLQNLLRWGTDSPQTTKHLYLTHRLIARKSKYKELFEIYNDDQIIKYKDSVKSKLKDDGVLEDFLSLPFDAAINYAEAQDLPQEKAVENFINDNPLLYEQAKKQKFKNILKIYNKTDLLLRPDNQDDLIKHLFKIQNMIYLYAKEKYSDFIEKSEYKIHYIRDKKTLEGIMDNLKSIDEAPIKEVIDFADKNGICKIDDKVKIYKTEYAYRYNRIKNINYRSLKAVYEYVEELTPFSTQHKVKGAEYNNTLVVLDNGGWRNYNFESLFTSNNRDNSQQLLRTQKLFYVCCTRAKENLAVYYHKPSSSVINTAKQWFGENNVYEI